MARRRASSAQRGGSAGGASRSARSGRGAASGGRSSSSPRLPFWPLTTDNKIDLVGGLLILVGVLTFLGIIIQPSNLVARAWLDLWRRLFGWGLIFVPLALVVAGAWLIARRFEDRLPRVGPGQWVGVAMLALGMLALLHASLRPADPQSAAALAAQGKGGGLIGAGVLALLVQTLGGLGAAVALLAWLLVAGLLVARRSLPELLSAIELRWPRPKDIGPSAGPHHANANGRTAPAACRPAFCRRFVCGRADLVHSRRSPLGGRGTSDAAGPGSRQAAGAEADAVGLAEHHGDPGAGRGGQSR